MLAQRILTAVVGIPIVLAALYYGGLFWLIVVSLLVLGGLLEFARLGGPRAYLDYLLLSGLSFLLLTYSGINGTKLLIWLVVQLFYYLLRASFGGMYNFAAAFNILGVLYVALPLSFLWNVRATFGLAWTVFGLLTTWATDTGAYFGGTRYGRRKLSPKISPNKSVEGALFGCLTALIFGLVFALVTQKPFFSVGGLALFLSVVAQLGDLVQSALKREQAVKDTGRLLPGHGGILDRFDSLGFVFPMLYILLNLLPPNF